MSQTAFKSGFSLTEVLMAAGILLVGFLLIAGTFPVGVKLTAVATERTIGAVASEEAMAKIHLYGIDPAVVPYYDSAGSRMFVHVPYDGISVAQFRLLPPAVRSGFISASAYDQLRFRYPVIDALDVATGTFPAFTTYFQYESLYPSTVFFDYSVPANPAIKKDAEDPQRYFWSALCRRLDSTSTEVQVTVFVSRMAGQNVKYPFYLYDRTTGIVPVNASPWASSDYPTPVPVLLQTVTGSHIGFQQGPRWTYYFQKLSPVDKTQAPYISKGAILLDDRYGRLMRVLDVRFPDPAIAADSGEITLFRPVDSDGNPATVVPSDGDGMLLQEYAAPNTVYRRWVWVVPPALAANAVAGPSNTPPKVVGRHPCVGVYQGQL